MTATISHSRFNRQTFRLARTLAWTYFLLIIFEGVLRKWIFPSLSSPLLFLRDPILLTIYVIALQNKWYVRNLGLGFMIVLAFVTLFLSIQFNPDRAAIALYGFRSNFLHLPLLWILPRLFDREDALKFGRFLMIFALPMAILMALQFLAPPSSKLNAGAGEGATQIASALGRIRPAGTFSFIVGPVSYFALTTAFLVYAYFHFMARQKLLIFASLGATLIAFVVSGSRSLAGSCLLTLALALAAMTLVRTSDLRRTLTFFVVLSGMILGAAQVPILNDAYLVLTTRIGEADRFEGGLAATLTSRVFNDFTRPMRASERVPLLGEGLGMGTIGGGALLTGGRALADGESESEWSRHIIESGPVLGYAFIFFRVYLLWYLARIALKSARRGNSLPFVLLGSIASPLLLGQLGQSTIAAFTIFAAGLVLSAGRETPESEAAVSRIEGKAAALKTRRVSKRGAGRLTGRRARSPVAG